jgi:hypothetical protein
MTIRNKYLSITKMWEVKRVFNNKGYKKGEGIK